MLTDLLIELQRWETSVEHSHAAGTYG